MAKRPKYTSRETSRHGRPQWYFRRYGRRIRLPDEFGTDEWWQAYDAALSGRKPLVRGNRGNTFAGLIKAYMDCPAFNALARGTRFQRAAILRDAATKAGDAPPAAVTQQSVRQVMQSRPPYAANNFLKAMRGLYKWAIEMGYITEDPTQGVKMNRPKSDGWQIWTPLQIDRFRCYWEETTLPRRCFEIALATGLRRSDLVLLCHNHAKFENNRLTHWEIKAQKTGVECFIPYNRHALYSYIVIHPKELPYIVRESGKPFTAESLGNWFRDACVEAGIPPGMRLHSLRKTAATMDAEDGWTANELMAKYGWTNIKEAEHYTRQADRKQLALNAGKTRPQ